MSGYLRVDMTRLSFAEAWRWGGLRHVVVLAVWKLLGIRRFAPQLVPDSSGITRIDSGDAGEDQRRALSPILEEVRGSGFEVLFWYKVENRGSGDSVAVAVLHESGRAMGIVTHVVTGLRRRESVGLVSRRGNGTFLATSNARTAFDPPPEIVALRLPGRPAPEVCRAHRERLQGVDVVSIATADVEPLIVELQTLAREAAIRRGLYVPAAGPGER